jgi:hypothetical protein
LKARNLAAVEKKNGNGGNWPNYVYDQLQPGAWAHVIRFFFSFSFSLLRKGLPFRIAMLFGVRQSLFPGLLKLGRIEWIFLRS